MIGGYLWLFIVEGRGTSRMKLAARWCVALSPNMRASQSLEQ